MLYSNFQFPEKKNFVQNCFDMAVKSSHPFCSLKHDVDRHNTLKVSLRVFLILFHPHPASVPSCIPHSSYNVCTVSIIIPYSIDFPMMSFLRSILMLPSHVSFPKAFSCSTSEVEVSEGKKLVL